MTTWQVRRHRAGRRGLWIAQAAVAVAMLAAFTAVVVLRELAEPQWQLGQPATAHLARADEELTGPPTRLRIPAIGIDAPLAALHMDESGELEAPADYELPGWYEEGATPGETGPAVIAGHLDSRKGKAIFYRLHELRPDDVILVQRDGKWLTFE